MGLKFWKKEEDDFSDLGDFGLTDFDKKTESPAQPAMPAMAQPDPFTQTAPMQQTADHTMQQQAMPEPQQTPDPMNQPTFPSTADRFNGMQQRQPMPGVPPVQPPSGGYDQKDLEIISAKLDSLKATLESINQRLANLERMAQGDDKNKYAW